MNASPSPSDFPEKVWLGPYGPDGALVVLDHFDAPGQPYFSAPLVEERLDEIAAALGEPGVAADVSAARAAVSKAQSSLGVKG